VGLETYCPPAHWILRTWPSRSGRGGIPFGAPEPVAWRRGARPPRAVAWPWAEAPDAGGEALISSGAQVGSSPAPHPIWCWCNSMPTPTCATAGSGSKPPFPRLRHAPLPGGASPVASCCKIATAAAPRGIAELRHSGPPGGHRPRPLSASPERLQSRHWWQPWRPCVGDRFT